jgi:hypothetical protein
MPRCAIRLKCLDLAIRYVYPLGLWQNWSMFAPNPMQHTIMLEALAVDNKGILHNFAFPKMADFTMAQDLPRVRHSKFAAYIASDEFDDLREIAARHVARRLEIPPEGYPVEVELRFTVRDTPPPGTVPDPMAPTRSVAIKSFQFDRWEVVHP